MDLAAEIRRLERENQEALRRVQQLEDQLTDQLTDRQRSTPETLPHTNPSGQISEVFPSLEVILRQFIQAQTRTNSTPPRVPINHKGPKPFSGKEGTLEKFLFQMDEFLRLYKGAEEEDKLSILSLSLEGSALDWWHKRRARITTWEEAKEALLSKYESIFEQNKVEQNNARRELEELTQTGRIQDYLAEVRRLNGHANLAAEAIIELIYRKIKPKLREMMAPFEKIRGSNRLAWTRLLTSCGEYMEQLDLYHPSTNPNSSSSTSAANTKKRSADQISTSQASSTNQSNSRSTTGDRPSTELVPQSKKNKGLKAVTCPKFGREGHRCSTGRWI